MRGKMMKKLLAVLVLAGLVGQAPVIAGQSLTCDRHNYYCEWNLQWGSGYPHGGKLLCPQQKVCGGKQARGCTCSTKVFGS